MNIPASDIIKDNLQFLAILIIWILAGIASPFVGVAAIALSVILLKKKGMHMEILLGFFFILILSDSREYAMEFAAKGKDIYLVLMALMMFIDKNYFKPFNKLYQYLLLFILIAFISLINSENPIVGAQKTLSYLLVFMVIPNYLLSAFRERGDDLLKGLTMTGIIILGGGLAMKFISPDLVTLAGRFNGLLGNPNGLGIFSFLFFLMFSIIKSYRPTLFSKNEVLLIYGLIFISVWLSGSRGSLLAMVIFMFFSYFNKMSPFLGFILLLIAIVVNEIVTANMVSIVLALGLQDFFRLDTLEQGSGRLIAWVFIWEHIQDNLFLGKGFAHTEYIFRKNYNKLAMMGHQGNAHNSFLTFWMDTGLIGLLAYIIGIFAIVFKAAQNSRLAVPVLYAVCFSAFFESWLTASLNPFTIQFIIIFTILIFIEPRNEGVKLTQ